MFLTKVADMPKEECVVETLSKGAKGKKGRTSSGPTPATPSRGRPPAAVSSTVSNPVATTTGEFKIFVATSNNVDIKFPFLGSVGLPLGTAAPATVPGSTATTTIAPPNNVQATPVTTTPAPAYVAQPIETPVTALSVVPPAQPAKSKKGVKRKVSVFVLISIALLCLV